MPIQVTVVESDVTNDSAPVVENALRLLARLMVRAHHAHRDYVANPSESRVSSALTVSPNPRPDHVDDAA